MIIEHVINNNIISTFDGATEIVVSGKGIGFGKHKGDSVDDWRVEKIYRMENKEKLGAFKDLLVKVPLEYLKITDEIINMANQKLNCELNENIYITLTDHINFALERYKKGMQFENALTAEVKVYYPVEFHIGQQAVKMIRERTGNDLKVDEAASIALHLVSAEYSTKMSVAYEMTQTVNQIFVIIHESLDPYNPFIQEKMEELIPSIKHFAFRVLMDKQYQDNDLELFEFIKQHYKTEYECCNAIAGYTEKRFDKQIAIEEKSHLILTLKMVKRDTFTE